MKNIIFTVMIITLLSIGSCKDNDRREDEMITPEGTVTETTIETNEAADTTNRAEEDSLIEAPSP